MSNGKPDEVDYKIMAILQQDAMINLETLATKVFRSRTTVHDRIQRLKESGYIRGFTAILDRELTGLPVFVIVHIKLKEQSKTALLNYEQRICALPAVQYCLHVSGAWDFIVHVGAATPQAYCQFLLEELCDDGHVAHVESSFVLRECKESNPLSLLKAIHLP